MLFQTPCLLWKSVCQVAAHNQSELVLPTTEDSCPVMSTKTSSWPTRQIISHDWSIPVTMPWLKKGELEKKYNNNNNFKTSLSPSHRDSVKYRLTWLQQEGLVSPDVSHLLRSLMYATDNLLLSKFSPMIHVFLDTPPEKCFAQIKRRGRLCDEGITLQTLRNLHAIYKNDMYS